VVLDTETTGLDPRQGHRLIEIGAIEMINRRPTGNHFHTYLNPGREVDAGATQVHGKTWDDLKDEPLFGEVVEELLQFVAGAEVLIHNAAFDTEFLDTELGLLGRPPIRAACAEITDTLRLAKELHPGKRNNLDALCERYQIDHARRTLHGALLDAQLLAEVYLAMTRGQDTLLIEPHAATTGELGENGGARGPLCVLAASAAELADHQNYIEGLAKAAGGKCVWLAEH
jgi:DNA polymerase-3 subunit epsilon